MKTIKTVEIIPEFVEFIPDSNRMEDFKIYISEEFQTSSHLCLCGCKNLVVMPLSVNFWTLSKKGDVISIQPSVGNYNLDCKSHYIITNNKANFV